MNNTKIILGLDLGVSSIGWAIIAENNGGGEILGMGCRIIPLSADDKDEFASGNKISKNQKRTQKRTQRKGYDRYQLRRKLLTQQLLKHDMFDATLFKLKPLELWGLRAKAVTEKISLKELGRVLYHLNQKRGYKSSRSDANMDKKDTEYVSEVKNRHAEIKDQGISIGQKFYSELQKNEYYRIKQQVFPREAYIEEFDAICKQQQMHYPEVLTDDFISNLRHEIIYYQRKLKSQKGLVGVCDFERFETKTKEGKKIFVGPKVAHRSSPLFQVCKIWESINNIKLRNKRGETLLITVEQKREIFDYLDNHERLTQSELFKILGLKKDDGWYGNKMIAKGLSGNVTKEQILEVIKEGPFDKGLLTFDVIIDEKPEEKAYLVDQKTGEIVGSTARKVVTTKIETQPFYKLWHTVYSISDMEECANALVKNFEVDKDLASKLARLDFSRFAFGNKSVKAIRKILPYLMEGYTYSDACALAGYNHSNFLIKEGNLKRQLLDVIPNLPKNTLRQPVVEKILNQMINLVNAVIAKYGRPSEIRVELARELKQSREERNETFKNLNKRERENEAIRKRLQAEYGVRATRNNVIKWRLFHEISGDDSKVNATCIYCGKQFGITDALLGRNVDVEHIIPKSLLFDDSQSNKTLSHRTCNETKDNKTAFDFMSTKGEAELEQYVERVDNLYKNKIIGKAKRDKLLMPVNKIPQDFIDRQKRETQYISRKAKEILEQVCYNVWSTSGNVTAYLRKIWGWDDVLMNLQLPDYREHGLVQWVEWESNNGRHRKEVIGGWTKRDDHRHHAVDALTVACTRQGFIQRLNTLSSQHTRDEMFASMENKKKEFREKLSLLDIYLVSQRPYTTRQVEEKAAEILVSFKAGKKVATFGTRKVRKDRKKVVVQTGIIVPRGPLSEESIYGKIKTMEKRMPVKYLFENPHLIFKPYIKALVEERLAKFEGDTKKALASLIEDPIYLKKEKKTVLEFGSCFKEEYVIKYPLESIKAKDIIYIIDEKVKNLVKERLLRHENKERDAFREPLYFNENKKIPIRTVRMFTGLSAVEPIKWNEDGLEIGFVKPGNNHHIAFYINENGKKQAHLCSFWQAVERKKHNVPIIIEKPIEVWDKIFADKDEQQYSDSFLQKLPKIDWVYDSSLQQNEMFILGMPQVDVDRAMTDLDMKGLSKHLFRVQKLSIKGNGQMDLWFRMHQETLLNDSNDARVLKRFYNVQSIGAFEKLNPVKVRLNNLGELVL